MSHSFYRKIYKLHNEDIYLLAGTLGFFTTAVYLIVDYLLSRLFKANPIPYYSAQLVLSHHAMFWYLFYGTMADLIAGTFLGAVTAFVLERSNYKNLLPKGIIAGGVLWIMHVSLIPKFWDLRLLQFVNPPTSFISFYTHVFWGALYGFIFDQFVPEINSANEVTNEPR